MWMCNVLLPRWLAQRIPISITHQVIGPGRPDRNKLIAYKLISQSEFGLPDQDPVLADCGSSSYQADLAAVTAAMALSRCSLTQSLMFLNAPTPSQNCFQEAVNT